MYLELIQNEKKLSLIFIIFSADPDQLKGKVKDLETQLKTSDLEKQHMEVIKYLKYLISVVLWKQLLKAFYDHCIWVFRLIFDVDIRVHYIHLKNIKNYQKNWDINSIKK